MKKLEVQFTDRDHFQNELLVAFANWRNVVFLNDNGQGINHMAFSRNDDVLEGEYQYGFVSYDYKNNIEHLESKHPDYIEFPEHRFFTPQVHVLVSLNNATIQYNPDHFSKEELSAILAKCTAGKYVYPTKIPESIELHERMTKEEYLKQVQALQEHIQQGDIYEVNFCQEFYSNEVSIDPFLLYHLLSQASPTPFSCFVKHDESYLICASPERYVQKTKDKLISQPIKGTISRGKDESEDLALKNQLLTDPKERSENVMIVDLVRNDLAKVAQKNSVIVDELMGVYTFPQVHQLISTIRAKVKPDISFREILNATFPMGSMTGAPKIRAMELIEDFEKTKRGLYSGTVGYITPENDFDFNVVIRSITYNSKNKYLSYMVGGAITALSDPELEYSECLLKAKAMREVLRND